MAPPRRASRRLHVYVAEARFALAKPAASIDLSKLDHACYDRALDPSIKHRLIQRLTLFRTRTEFFEPQSEAPMV